MTMTDITITDLIRIGAALLAGALIGMEREFRDKSAGFRTMIFIAMGSAMFTIISVNFAGATGDSTRIAAYVVSGIGFLGAGAILRDGNHVTGLTTAASIWLTAAIGMAMGIGDFIFGGLVTALTLIVLWLFPYFQRVIDQTREEDTYHIVFKNDSKKLESVDGIIRSLRLRILSRRQYKEGSRVKCRWVVVGKPDAHEKFVQLLLADPEIEELNY